MFRFIPLGDRQIKREHKPVSDIVAQRCGTIVTGRDVCIQRYKVVESLLASDDADGDKLADHIAAIKYVKGAVKAFSFNHHPVFEDVFKIKDEHWGQESSGQMWRFLQALVYRQDLSTKCQQLSFAKQFSEKGHEKKQRESNRRTKPILFLPWSCERVLLTNAGGHLKQIASEYFMVSMPLGADGGIQLVTDTLQEKLFEDRQLIKADVAT